MAGLIESGPEVENLKPSVTEPCSILIHHAARGWWVSERGKASKEDTERKRTLIPHSII